MESFNRKPKDLKRESRCFSDFNYTRNSILLTTRKNPRIKGVPKSMDQILSKKGNVSFKEYIKLDRDKSTFKSHRDFSSEIEITFKHF